MLVSRRHIDHGIVTSTSCPAWSPYPPFSGTPSRVPFRHAVPSCRFGMSEAGLTDPRALLLLQEAYRHCKAIVAWVTARNF
jgi:hypothetical protein